MSLPMAGEMEQDDHEGPIEPKPSCYPMKAPWFMSKSVSHSEAPHPALVREDLLVTEHCPGCTGHPCAQSHLLQARSPLLQLCFEEASLEAEAMMHVDSCMPK